MAYDGRLIFGTKIDNSQIQKDLKKIETEIRKAQEKIASAKNAKLPLTVQLEDTRKQLDAAEKSLEQYQKRFAELQNITLEDGISRQDKRYKAAVAEIPQARDNVTNQQKVVDSLKLQWEGINNSVGEYDRTIREATNDLERNETKATELNAKLNSNAAKMQEAFRKVENTTQKLSNQILRVGASMVMFRVFSSVMQGIGKYMNQVLNTNAEYVANLAQLRGALLTAFQPIYEFILPGLNAVLRILTAIVSVVANVLSIFSGKTAAQSAKNAKALNKQAAAIGGVGEAAKEASKQLMGFDEINRLESTDANSGGGESGGGAGSVAPDFSAFDTAEYKAKIDELTVYLSGALLALGAILAFSGTNIPLGLGLMAVGAVGLAAVVKENWGAMDDDLKGALGSVAAILGGAALGLGAILAFSGTNVPLGLALMASGAVALAAAAKLDWSNIQNALKGPVGEVVTIASGAALALGAVLAFSGVNVPLGIGLIAIGAAGLATATAVNWDSIQQALKGPVGGLVASLSILPLVFGALLLFSGVNIPLGLALVAAGLAGTVAATSANWNFIKDKMTELGDWLRNWIGNLIDYLNTAFADGFINGLANMWADAQSQLVDQILEFFNWFVDNWNSIWGNISGYHASGSIGDTSGWNMPAVSYMDVPALARGAVLPANKPFMAMVGDQHNGTNVEAPLATIEQALRNVMAEHGNGDITINFTGDLAQLARVLTPDIKRESRNLDRAHGR